MFSYAVSQWCLSNHFASKVQFLFYNYCKETEKNDTSMMTTTINDDDGFFDKNLSLKSIKTY
uniref:SFRICE_023693 n=1 Tax=Spodoptera frugiperda TaxID=7108 RepID=A0A2H1VHC3_SPOFR